MVDTLIETSDLFASLRDEWKSESQYMSNSAQMAMLASYQRIIGMGQPALPLILKELQREPDHWFWALRMISRVDPTREEHRGDVEKMASDWIVWGKSEGLIES